ncbi:MAG TPA: fibronectin type III domain-containing protein [Candidatus Polarisedimenticolia bacterium]|nr:fibronectin type III domain-containing protein [Candidatus Polarisedimenticolia bacterium]
MFLRAGSFFGCALVLALLAPAAALAQVCDPPGPPPRFGCSWSTDSCDWVCAVCDPFGVPPRSGCSWSLELCNWICPGYTGVRVTVQTVTPPSSRATVYVRLASLCTATGASATCSGSFDVTPATTAEQTCAGIAAVVAQHCGAAGYELTLDACAGSARFEAANAGCPKTPFALGVSDDPAVFDQTGAGALPDGQVDTITGSTAACALTPGPVTGLRVAAPDAATLALTWDPATDADDYIIFMATSADGSDQNVAGTSDTTTVTLPMPAATEYFKVVARNFSCGPGPGD